MGVVVVAEEAAALAALIEAAGCDWLVGGETVAPAGVALSACGALGEARGPRGPAPGGGGAAGVALVPVIIRLPRVLRGTGAGVTDTL